MMFLDCPAWLDEDGAVRCGLPAAVRRRFITRSTSGPLESAMVSCPAGHWFNGPIEFLTWEGSDKRPQSQPKLLPVPGGVVHSRSDAGLGPGDGAHDGFGGGRGGQAHAEPVQQAILRFRDGLDGG